MRLIIVFFAKFRPHTRSFIVAIILVSLFALQVQPSFASENNLPVHYPSPYWNTDGETATTHIFVGGIPVATIETSGTSAPKVFWNHADRLGSTRIVTDGTGKVTETADYEPFGDISSEVSPSGHREQRKFTSHEYDSHAPTNYTYAQARYLDTKTGRFLSEDPAFWNTPRELLADPQQMNSYAYARGNPLRYIDPDGKLNVVIAGTWGGEWTNWQNNSAMSNFVNAVAETFGPAGGGIAKTRVEAIPELGDNRASRAAVAERITTMVNGYEFAAGETLNIVGHSHGGNVAAILSNTLDHPIDNLVTLGTPVREDYVFNESNIGTHVQGYSRDDMVQINGGGQFRGLGYLLGLGGFASCGPVCGFGGFLLGNQTQYGETGPAGRIIDGAKNVDVTNYTDWYRPAGSHSQLYSNINIWNNEIRPLFSQP